MLDKISFACFFVSAVLLIAFEIAGYLRVISYEEATFWMLICFFSCYLNKED